MIYEAALQIGHHLVPKRSEVEHLPIPTLQLTLHLLIHLLLGKLLNLLLQTINTSRLLENDQAIQPDLVFPVRCFSERIVLEIDLQSFQSSQWLKYTVICNEIACDVEIGERFERHEIVKSTLQTVVGKIKFLKVRKQWKVLQLAEIAVGECQGLELRVSLKEYLCLGWDKLEIERGDDNGNALLIGILPLQQLLYYLCIVRHSIIFKAQKQYSNNCHREGEEGFYVC